MPFDGNTYRQSAAIQLLSRARERIATNGFCKEMLISGERYCAIGSLRNDPDMMAIEDAIAALYSALPWWRRIGVGGGWPNLSRPENKIARYNDAPRTTQADVLALYDRAIKRLTRRNP